MVLHNPNNWHWVNKDVSAWAKEWFTENLTKLEAQNGDVKVKVSKVQSMDGDVDVSQRKGKVITIFDVKLVLEYTGTVTNSDLPSHLCRRELGANDNSSRNRLYSGGRRGLGHHHGT
jgi:activator of HSP90 ATPase